MVTTEKVFLESINYESTVTGRWILGSDYISDKQYYVAYEILEDGGKKLFKMDAEKTIIYDILKENDTAYLEIEKNGNGVIKAMRLYVTDGTIVRDYDLSLD